MISVLCPTSSGKIMFVTAFGSSALGGDPVSVIHQLNTLYLNTEDDKRITTEADELLIEE